MRTKPNAPETILFYPCDVALHFGLLAGIGITTEKGFVELLPDDLGCGCINLAITAAGCIPLANILPEEMMPPVTTAIPATTTTTYPRGSKTGGSKTGDSRDRRSLVGKQAAGGRVRGNKI